MISIVAVSSYEIDFSLQSYADAFLVIFDAKIDYNAYQAGIKDVLNAQAGSNFLQDVAEVHFVHQCGVWRDW